MFPNRIRPVLTPSFERFFSQTSSRSRIHSPCPAAPPPPNFRISSVINFVQPLFGRQAGEEAAEKNAFASKHQLHEWRPRTLHTCDVHFLPKSEDCVNEPCPFWASTTLQAKTGQREREREDAWPCAKASINPQDNSVEK